MTSELRVDKIHNEGGDNDSGLDMSTNDTVKIKIAGTNIMTIKEDGELELGTTSSSDSEISFLAATDGSSRINFGDSGDADIGVIQYEHDGNAMVFKTNASERMRLTSDGTFMVNTTDTSIYDNSSGSTADNGITYDTYALSVGRTNGTVFMVNRTFSDGDLISLRQNGTEEGTISVSTSTVSYNGFSGLHETSGIASNVAIGTVCSTIDELDVYPDTQRNSKGESEPHKKKGQTRKDHAKVKVSDSSGDKRVYGVLQRYDNNDKPLVASVGIGSVLVTGACAGGDLLESNGDGTAKVQSDDIVKSKTIGKVTIGNSSADVKLVSCVLYCG